MHTGSYINGKWFHPKSPRLVRNINPADLDDVIAEFPAATTEDVQRAIDAAQASFRAGRKHQARSGDAYYWRAATSRASGPMVARTLTREG